MDAFDLSKLIVTPDVYGKVGVWNIDTPFPNPVPLSECDLVRLVWQLAEITGDIRIFATNEQCRRWLAYRGPMNVRSTTDPTVAAAEDQVRGIVRHALNRHLKSLGLHDFVTALTNSVLVALEDELPDGYDALLEHAHHQASRAEEQERETHDR